MAEAIHRARFTRQAHEGRQYREARGPARGIALGLALSLVLWLAALVIWLQVAH